MGTEVFLVTAESSLVEVVGRPVTPRGLLGLVGALRCR